MLSLTIRLVNLLFFVIRILLNKKHDSKWPSKVCVWYPQNYNGREDVTGRYNSTTVVTQPISTKCFWAGIVKKRLSTCILTQFWAFSFYEKNFFLNILRCSFALFRILPFSPHHQHQHHKASTTLLVDEGWCIFYFSSLKLDNRELWKDLVLQCIEFKIKSQQLNLRRKMMVSIDVRLVSWSNKVKEWWTQYLQRRL